MITSPMANENHLNTRRYECYLYGIVCRFGRAQDLKKERFSQLQKRPPRETRDEKQSGYVDIYQNSLRAITCSDAASAETVLSDE